MLKCCVSDFLFETLVSIQEFIGRALRNITFRVSNSSFRRISGLVLRRSAAAEKVRGNGKGQRQRKKSAGIRHVVCWGTSRYVEGLSSYARQFLGQALKPDVECLFDLRPRYPEKLFQKGDLANRRGALHVSRGGVNSQKWQKLLKKA